MKQEFQTMKFRNRHGEVTMVYTMDGSTATVGASFCNPKDFNVPHKLRVQKGLGYALKRLNSMSSLTFENVPVEHTRRRLFFLEGLYNSHTSVVQPYLAHPVVKGVGDFVQWFPNFICVAMSAERKRVEESECDNTEPLMDYNGNKVGMASLLDVEESGD